MVPYRVLWVHQVLLYCAASTNLRQTRSIQDHGCNVRVKTGSSRAFGNNEFLREY